MSKFVWPAALFTALLAAPAALIAQRAPAPKQSNLPADTLALACAPSASYAQPDTPLRITGGQDAVTRRIYASGDLVTINAGAMNGIKVGQEFYIRRQLKGREHITGQDPITLRTASWLRVYAVDDTMSLATITHVCDSIEVGDYLEPFTLPESVAAAAKTGKPDRDHYARVMAGDDLRNMFGRGDFFTINRGANDGLKVGTQFVVYRDKHEEQNFMFELGEAVAVNVGPQLSTLKVTLSRDAFMQGDYVAERK